MRVAWRLNPKRLEHQQLRGRVGDVVLSTHNIGDASVEIVDCDVQSDDDAVCLKSSLILGTPTPCEDIEVARCRLRSGANAWKIGNGTVTPRQDTPAQVRGLSEAIAISGADKTQKQRVTALTTARCAGPGVKVNDAVFGAPYTIFAIGNPKGLDLTMSAGLLSSIRRNDQGQVFLLQTSAPISGGQPIRRRRSGCRRRKPQPRA